MKKFDFDSLFSAIGGIQPAVGDALNPLDSKNIKAFEFASKCTLPDSYCTFLKKYGAISFVEHVVYTPDQPFPETYSTENRGAIATLLGQKNPEYPRAKTIDIGHAMRLLKLQLDTAAVPIGKNSFGDFICMSFEEEDYGELYLWSHEGEVGHDYFHISESFEAWLSALRIAA